MFNDERTIKNNFISLISTMCFVAFVNLGKIYSRSCEIMWKYAITSLIKKSGFRFLMRTFLRVLRSKDDITDSFRLPNNFPLTED